MSFVVRKRDLTDPEQLQALIVEHADDLERGLTILDSRLLIGQATIDVVGLDADSALVLIAVGLIADEEMFLRAVEAYSWCLEYPAAICRLYPAAQLSSARPPRVMFVVERVPDAFHRKVKQLGFQEVDCVEFRHLDVDGTPAVYFETLARLRRTPVTIPPVPAQSAAPTAPVVNGRSTTQKLQKLLGADRGGREAAPIVRMMPRAPVRPESKPSAGTARTERIVSPRRVADEPPAPPPSPPIARVTDKPPVREPAPVPATEPIASPELGAATAVTEAVADLPDPLKLGTAASDTVETFVIIEEPAQNGHVVMLPNATDDIVPALSEREKDSPVERREPQVERREPDLRDPERAVRRAEPVIAEPVIAPAVMPEPAPAEAFEIVFDVVAAELSATAGPLAPEPPTEEPAAAVAGTPEPLTVGAAMSASEPVLELEPRQVERATEPPVIAAAEPAVTEPERPVVEPSVESREPILPAAAPTPATSVFARRTAEPATTRAEPKVSFAGVAKDSLSPAGPFAKAPTLTRPRTIAPPPSDGQPIAGGPKPATVPNRIAPPAVEPAPTAKDMEPPKAAPQSIGEVQFTNDGVLTRQWMEFLNQMAAGK